MNLISIQRRLTGPWAGLRIKTSDAWVQVELKKEISSLDWQKAREDVKPFIHETELGSLQYFTSEYFTRLADTVREGIRREDTVRTA